MFYTFSKSEFDVMFDIINATKLFDINYEQILWTYSRTKKFSLNHN